MLRVRAKVEADAETINEQADETVEKHKQTWLKKQGNKDKSSEFDNTLRSKLKTAVVKELKDATRWTAKPYFDMPLPLAQRYLYYQLRYRRRSWTTSVTMSKKDPSLDKFALCRHQNTNAHLVPAMNTPWPCH